MAFSTSSSSEHSEINVTPMIDVLLVLLIIFMVITPVTPRGLESQVPQPNPGNAQPQEDPIMIDVLAPSAGERGPHVLVNAKSVPVEGLAAQIAAMLKSRSDRTVFLRADRKLSFQSVAETIASAKQGGAVQIGLSGAPQTVHGEQR